MRVRRQLRPLVLTNSRFSVAVAHRRAGKTVAAVQRLILSGLQCPHENPRCSYIAPTYRQAKDVAWEYLKRFSRPAWGDAPNESELRVTLVNGARLRLYGAENADAMRGLYHDDAILDEYADMAPSVWPEVVRPGLSDRKGRALFIGTPKGRNGFYSIYDAAGVQEDWSRHMLKASQTGILAPSELAAAQRDMTPEQYAQEYECSFDAAILGAYYGKDVAEAERLGRIGSVPFEPSLPVHVAWDLGIGDSTALWFFQISGGEVRVCSHYENHGHPLSHYAAEIAVRTTGLPQGIDWVPHDARVRSLETGRTRVETLISLGRKPRLVPAHKIDDGINAARLTMAHCWFDADGTRDGLEALRQYRSEYDEKAKVFRPTPRHDWTSHSADAFRYMAMAWREIAPVVVPKRRLAEIVIGGESTVTLDQLWRDAERGSASQRI